MYELGVVAERGPTHSTGASGQQRKIWPPFSHVDVLVLLTLDPLMAPEDVAAATAARSAPSAATLRYWAHYSSTHINGSTLKLTDHGYVRVLERPLAKHWKQTPLYALTADGRALLARLFPPQPPR